MRSIIFFRSITIWIPTAILILLMFCGCSEETVTEPPVVVDLANSYAVIQGSGFVVGWSMIPDSMTKGSDTYRAIYHLPGHPWQDRVEVEYSFQPNGVRVDRNLGSQDGSFTETRLQIDGDSWAWSLDGWGELDLVRDLLPAVEEPLIFDPYSPLPPILMGWRWHDAGRPDNLDLPVLLTDDPQAPPVAIDGHLTFNGKVNEGSVELLWFDLELGSYHYFFKLIADKFPTPYRTWWERTTVSLEYWGDVAPNVDDQLFAPVFPAVEDYTVEQITFSGDGLDLAAEILTPTGDGPFPALLLVTDNGPAHRDDAAVFGHLAHHLAQDGYLVFRYDKPGTGASPGLLDQLDLTRRRQVIGTAWDTLRALEQSDTTRCFILGRGEGAALALERAAADDQDQIRGVIALAPTMFDPSRVRDIPEAAQAPGETVVLLEREVFVGKYKDLLQLDSADFLGSATCPVALYRGLHDEVLAEADFIAQGEMLDLAGVDLAQVSFEELSHFFTVTRPDAPPHPDVRSAILEWLGSH
jgi:dienelactone hydrolase